MAGVNGRYDSVILGVSQQAAIDRRSGQMEGQDNFISDPVRGLARRWGTEQVGKKLINSAALTDAQLVAEAGKFLTKAFFCDGNEYELIYSKEPVQSIGAIHCYDRVNKKFLEVVYDGFLANAIGEHGVASMVNTGRFMNIAVNNHTPRCISKDFMPGVKVAKPGVLWIRQGSYDRDYAIVVTRPDGSQVEVTHRTMSATSDHVLDTSDIPYDKENPGAYTKAVADRTNEHNAIVTAHMKAAADDIMPNTIARKLRDKMAAQLGLGNSIANTGPYVYFNVDANICNVTTKDGGDSTFMRAVVDMVDDIDKLSPWHYTGKTMRISPKKQADSDAYYVQATTKDGSGFGEVTWKECPGVLSTPVEVFCIAWADGSKLYVGSSPESLNSMTQNRADAPKLEPSVVGDLKTSPVPYFLQGHSINYLGLFQDRLIIASGAVVFASRPGDYYNWFRSTVLSVEDDDPVEMFALGSEDDTIRWDSSFDRNHILHGEKKQYLLPGRTILTPKNPSIQIMSSLEGTTICEPQASGSFVYFAKGTFYGGSLHQIQMGQSADSAESYECSQQLDTYIDGVPGQILTGISPYFVFLRLKNSLNKLYVYTYLDSMQGGERMFDSWSRWTWDEALGPCCGLSYFREEFIKFSMRRGLGGTYMVADQMWFHSEAAPKPYLDSMQNFGKIRVELESWPKEITDRMFVVYGNESDKFLMGAPYKNLKNDLPEVLDPANADKAWVGFNYDAVCRLTNPFIRDQNGKSIINGRLTLSNVTLLLVNSGGVAGYVEASGRRQQTLNFEGRLLSRATNKIGRVPVVDYAVKFPVFREVRECQTEFRALSWLPLTVSGIEWKGQYFNNLKRV